MGMSSEVKRFKHGKGRHKIQKRNKQGGCGWGGGGLGGGFQSVGRVSMMIPFRVEGFGCVFGTRWGGEKGRNWWGGKVWGKKKGKLFEENARGEKAGIFGGKCKEVG